MAHEERLLKLRADNSFKKIKVDFSDTYIFNYEFSIWKKIETFDQLRTARLETGVGLVGEERKYDNSFLNDSNHADLKIDDWYSYCYEDGGDSRGTYHVYTLEYFKNILKEALDEITVKTEKQ